MRGTTTHDRRQRGQHRAGRRIGRSRAAKIISAVMGAVLAGGGAFAAAAWLIGLNSGSSGEGQSATISNLTISATASPSATNLLYPGSTGDVVITIANPNPYPVTVTAVNLPTNTTYATGYSNSSLTTAQAGCTSSTSLVGWNFATASTGTSHTLTTPVTVAPSGQSNNPLTVTLTNVATMSTSSPSACAGTFFSMPSFTGITATSTTGTATTSPATSGWTS
jgi:hypothetical protein